LIFKFARIEFIHFPNRLLARESAKSTVIKEEDSGKKKQFSEGPGKISYSAEEAEERGTAGHQMNLDQPWRID
jgi:hypothetical protein